MILTENLYLTSDRSLVVREGDKRAAFLIGVRGQTLPDKIAKKYGILKEPEPTLRDEPQVAQDPQASQEVVHRESGLTVKRRGRQKHQ